MTEQSGSAAVSEAPSTQTAILDTQMDNGTDTSVEGRGASFTDFDSMEEARREYKESRQGKGEQSEQAQTPKKTVPKGQDEKTKLLKDLEGESDEDAGPNNQGQPKKAKTLKAIDGDKAIDINPQAVVEIPVDGQKQKVTIQKLIDDFNGKVAYDKRFTELDRERKQYQKDKEIFNNQSEVFRTFVDQAQKDPTKAILYALDRANLDPHDFINKFRESVLGDVEAIADMLPEERRAYFLQKENEFLKERTRTHQERTREEQGIQATLKRIDEVRQSTGVTEEEFQGAYNKCLELGEQKPTIERVADVAVRQRAISKTQNILSSINPQLLNDRSVFDITWKHVMDGDFSDGEIAQVVRDTLGVRAKKVLQQANPARKPTTSGHPSKTGTELFSDFED